MLYYGIIIVLDQSGVVNIKQGVIIRCRFGVLVLFITELDTIECPLEVCSFLDFLFDLLISLNI